MIMIDRDRDIDDRRETDHVIDHDHVRPIRDLQSHVHRASKASRVRAEI